MTMDTTIESGRESGSLTKAQPKRSFDVAFLTGANETHEDRHQASPDEDDDDDDDELRASAAKKSPEHKADGGSPKSAFKKVAKASDGAGSGGPSAANHPVDLSLISSPYYHPFAFPAIATTLSLQLLQHNTTKGLAMSLLGNPAAAVAAMAQQSLFQHSAPKSSPSPTARPSAAASAAAAAAAAAAIARYRQGFRGVHRQSSAPTAGLLPALAASLASAPSQNVCAKCNLSFRMTSDLVYHMRSQHRRDAASDPVRQKRQEKLRCPVCGENFRERHHLTRHMTSHEDRDAELKNHHCAKLYVFLLCFIAARERRRRVF
nr:EOG090X0POW [Moina brachiata]